MSNNEKWPVTYIDCPYCGFTHDTEGESQPIHCHGCHKPFGVVDVILCANRMRKALEGFLAVADDSEGIAGYHLNGSIAKWDEFDFMDEFRALNPQPAQEERNAAATQMLESVRASLREYPHGGGDVEVMHEVDRIVAEATGRMRKALEDAKYALAQVGLDASVDAIESALNPQPATQEKTNWKVDGFGLQNPRKVKG